MDTYVIFADIGRAVFIVVACYIIAGSALAIHVWRHNITKFNAAKRLDAKEEIKSVFLSYVGIGIACFALCMSMYVADSIVAKIIIGIGYLVAFYCLFKKDRS